MGITTLASVYDGRQCVGFVLNHLDRRVFEAVDTENHSYGCFATYRSCCCTPVSFYLARIGGADP